MTLMTKTEELELFDLLARTKMRDWVKMKMEQEIAVLVGANDVELLRRAQGRASMLDSITKLMDAAPNAVKR